MEMNYELRKTLATNLRKYRAINKLSQEQLAELADLSQQYICNMEGEKVNPSCGTLMKLCTALKTTPNDLLL